MLEQNVEEELKQLDVDKIKPKMRDIRGKNPTVKQTLSMSNKVETNSSVNSKTESSQITLIASGILPPMNIRLFTRCR